MTMRITIRGASRLEPDVAELARARVTAAFSRFAGRVRSLTVRLADVNGPKGGDDTRCVIEVRMNVPRRTAIIEHVDQSVSSAIGHAAERAARTVARLVELDHDRRIAAWPLARY